MLELYLPRCYNLALHVPLACHSVITESETPPQEQSMLEDVMDIVLLLPANQRLSGFDVQIHRAAIGVMCYF